MFQPENEQGVIVHFAMRAMAFGWEIVNIRTAYPDATLHYHTPGGNVELWAAEFEYKSSNFLYHGHDPRICDLIICWENDWEDCPLPVLDISKNDWGFVQKLSTEQVELAYWKQRATRAEKTLKIALESGDDVEMIPVKPAGRPCSNDSEIVDAVLALGEQGVPVASLSLNFYRNRLGPSVIGRTLGAERARRIQRAVLSSLGLVDESTG